MSVSRRAVSLGLLAGGLAVLDKTGVAAAPPVSSRPPAPELVGGPWLNTEGSKPLPLASRKGKVTVVHFWTFGCINCKRNLPIYARWQKKFEKDGVVLVGVHTPETASEKVTANVEEQVKKLGITYPVLVDQHAENWDRWAQRWWPTVYLIDRNGRVAYRWAGELEWNNAGGEAALTKMIQELLAEK